MAWGGTALKNNQMGDPPLPRPSAGDRHRRACAGKGGLLQKYRGRASFINSHPTQSQLSLAEDHVEDNQQKPSGRAGGRGKSRAKCSRRKRFGYRRGCLRKPPTPAPAASPPRRRHLGRPQQRSQLCKQTESCGPYTPARQLGRALSGPGLPSPNRVSRRPRPPSKDKVLSGREHLSPAPLRPPGHGCDPGA